MSSQVEEKLENVEIPEEAQNPAVEEQSAEKVAEAKKLLKQLVDAGVHLGHNTKDWNPKMVDYIHSSQEGVHIINLAKTVNNLMRTGDFLKRKSKANANILFVGTSKQTSTIIKREAERAGIYFINQRWLGGLITNFDTIRSRLNKLRELENNRDTGAFKNYGKKEVARLNRQIMKLNKSLGGLKKMRGRAEIIVVFDQNKDAIAITEAKKVGAKLVTISDTDCDPTGIDYVIPANNDSMRSVDVVTKYLADAILEGQTLANRKRI